MSYAMWTSAWWLVKVPVLVCAMFDAYRRD